VIAVASYFISMLSMYNPIIHSLVYFVVLLKYKSEHRTDQFFQWLAVSLRVKIQPPPGPLMVYLPPSLTYNSLSLSPSYSFSSNPTCHIGVFLSMPNTVSTQFCLAILSASDTLPSDSHMACSYPCFMFLSYVTL
jgi:hypothetical protein